MSNKGQATLQIGKNGLTPGFFEILENTFKERENVKVHFLKSAGHDKNKVKEMTDQIIERLGKKYTYRILGFTIFLKKWRKARQ